MKKAIYAFALLAVFSVAGVVSANHSWGGYHWARTSNPFTLKLGNNLTSQWNSYLQTTSSDWSQSSVLDTSVVAGTALRNKSANKDCSPVSGTVQVCNKAYGKNGWLGIAQIWLSNGHIVQGTTKMNDTYFATSQYNSPAWRNLVMCQEVGHTFGLDHQDEMFGNANLGTCMDYTNDPTSNQHPNAHDYEELGLIYAHLDTFNSYSTTASITAKGGVAQAVQAGAFGNASDWGQAQGHDAQGRANSFVRKLGDGVEVVTHVYWVDEE